MEGLGPRARQRLSDEQVIWLTTVTRSGRPQTSPVWFLWDGAEFLVYSLDDTARLRNIEANPRVGLNLDGDGRGGAVVVIEGTAHIDRSFPSSDRMPAYAAKYRERILGNGWTPESFARDYPVPIRIEPGRVRAW